MAGWRSVESVPFDSCDASSWATAPARFGQFAGFTGRQIHLKTRMTTGIKSDLWCEVLEHMKRAKWSENRWKRELSRLTNRSENM
jgi:hypothetical protein